MYSIRSDPNRKDNRHALHSNKNQCSYLRFEEKKHMAFAGDNGACAMIQVVAYGNAPAIAYEQLTQKITQIISEELSIEPSRIYVAYSETDIWGWSGHNF